MCVNTSIVFKCKLHLIILKVNFVWFFIIIRADVILRQRGYSDHFVTMYACVYVWVGM